MPITTVQVAIAASMITGAALPRARVRFELVEAGVDASVVVPTSVTVTLDNNGVGQATLWGNTAAQYNVTITSEAGKVCFTGFASIPTQNCSLHDVLHVATPGPNDAEKAVAKAREWAIKTDGAVEGSEYSAKYHAQQAAEDAQATGQDRDATGQDRTQTGLDRVQTGADRVQTGADRVQTGADALATNTAKLAAQAAQTAAEAARDALNTTGKVYTAAEGTAAGIAGTVNGQQFAVIDASLNFWIIYRNNAGVGLELTRGYTKAYFDGLIVRTGYRGWAYAVTDAAGKLAFGVTALGKFILGVGGDIVSRITTNETNIDAQQAQFVRTSRGNSYAWVLLDAAKTKVALAVTSAGRLISLGRDVLSEIDIAKIASNAIKQDGNARSARAALVDATGKAPWMVSRAGRVLVWGRDVLTELDSVKLGSAPSTVRENSAYLTYTFTDGAGKLQVKAMRKSDGKIATITSTGNNLDPVLTSDNKVLFVTESGGLYVQNYAPADGGSIFPTLAARDLACWGDSLTAGAGATGGQTYPAQLLTMLNDGRSAYNGGIGGQTSAQIAARQGGTLSQLTVAGNQIPASGAVNVTARTVSLITSQGQQSFTGTLAGVPGTLARAGDDSYTFTRTTAGSAVACPAGTPFIPDVAVQYRGNTAILIYGRNSIGDGAAATLAIIASSVAYLTPYYKNFLVGLILNGTTEGIGTGTYNSIKTINDAIKAAYPTNYLDTQAPPTAGEMTALSFVPDATDNADIANDCIPTRMRNYGAADTLHLNNSGYGLWALRAKTIIQAKGW